MKRLRWGLILAVLVVTVDLARTSIATLSQQRETAEPAAEQTLRSVGTAAANVRPRRPRPGSVEDPRRHAPFELSDGPSANSGAIDDALAPAAPENAPSPASLGLTRTDPVREADYLHPAVWPAQLALSHAAGVWQHLSWSMDRVRGAPVPFLWPDPQAPVSARPPNDGDRVPPEIQDPIPADAPLPTLFSAPPRLVLRNGRASSGQVHFLVNDKVCSLSPGETIELTGESRWLVRFHRGGDLGDAAYSLWPGRYEFLATGGGWDVVREEH